MRVSRAQAAENRKNVIEVASRLFRQHGFDGIGLNDLMKGAGLTQGGFYKQFKSKEDLAVQACICALDSNMDLLSTITQTQENPFTALIDFYFSARHRDNAANGCPLVALGADAARQGAGIKAAFQAGIEQRLDAWDRFLGTDGGKDPRRKSMVVLSLMVGALLLSRAVEDESLSTGFLESAAEAIKSDCALDRRG